MVLRAVDDPTDHLRIVSALRTPLFGCGDDDLFRHKVLEGRTWSYNTPTPPDPADGIVSAGLAFLLELHEARHWQLARRAARPHRPRPPRARARLRRGPPARRVAPPALRHRPGPRLERGHRRQPARSTSTGSSSRRPRAPGSPSRVLPETDDDAVRIMTIHAAKGLEFPITIVSGLSARPGGVRSPVEVHFPKDGGPVGYRMGKDVVTEEFEAAVPIDEQMGYDERLRLLYVACTRACDHLVVSLHRVERKNPPGQEQQPHQRRDPRRRHGRPARRPARPQRRARSRCRSTPPRVPAPPPAFAAWEAERTAALAVGQPPRRRRRHRPHRRGHPRLGHASPTLALPSRPCSTSPAAADRAGAWVGDDGDPGPHRARGRPRAAEAARATSTCRRG